MAITKLQPFNLDTTANYTFANVTASNVNGANLVSANYVTGTLTTAAQPNITSTGTLVNLTVSGNTSFSGANVSLGAVGNLKITGGTANYVLQTDGAGNLSWVAVSSGSTSNISNGNSNVNIPSSNGNINLTAVGNTTMIVTGTGVNVAGTLNVTGNATVGNIVTSGSGGNVSNVNVISANTFIASGNISANNINTTGSGGNIGNANVISANTFIASGNITAGNANLGNATTANYFIGNFYGTANSATTAGTVTTASQPNITSVGTLSSLIVTGNITAGNANLGNLVTANFFSGNGSLLTGITVSAGNSIVNGNSNVTVTANGNVNTSVSGNANILVVTGTGANINGTLNISGNTTVSNLISSGTGGNISNANVISANTFIASGNITAGNLITSGSGGNITGGNVISANTLNATLSANLGNSVTANFFIGSGANLTSIPAGNISGQVANALVASTVYTNAQPNITSIGTLTDLSVSGNGVFGGNLTVNGTLTYINSTTLSISDPIINLQTGANGVAPVANTGKDVGTALNYYDTSAKIAWMGWDISNAEIAFGSNVGISSEVVTFTSLANIRSGNASLGNLVTANFFTGNGSQLSALTFGNITTFSTAGLTTDELYLQSTTRLNVTASGSSGYLFDQYGATINPALYVTSGQTLAFNLNVSGHPFLIQTSGGANYSTGLEHVDTTGTVSTTTAAQGQIAGTLYWKIPYGITGNYKYQCSIHGGMNGNIVVTDANVANITVGLATFATTANAVAGANISGQVSNALVSGTVYTNAQPNITSIGSLTGLTVSNATGIVDFTTTANVSLGAVGNVKITGGTNAYVLSTDGAGNLSWVAQSGGGGGGSSISNGNSNVNIPTSNGNINFTAVGNTNMVITGTSVNVAGILNTTGNVTFTGANVSLGAVGNVKITGGSNAYVLSTDGAGNLSWAQASGTSIGVDNFTGNGVETSYTLATTPANANATLVSIAGTFQPRTVYSLTGNVITFSSAPPNTAPIEVTTFTAGSGGGGGGITAQDLLSPFLLMGA